MYKTLIVLAALAVASEQVSVSVYYDSLTPTCGKFIDEQLFPTWQELGAENVNVDFVPYGFAREYLDPTLNLWNFVCRNGPEECFANQVQACALNYFDGDQDLSVKFIHCVMSNDEPDKAGSMCAARVGTSWQKIESCIGTQKGHLMLIAHGDRTRHRFPFLDFVPKVVVNGVWDQATQDAALVDLKSVLCETFSDPKPAACNA